MHETYLEKGLTGLSRALERGWFHGHYGAAAICAALLWDEHAMHGRAAAAMREQVDRMIAEWSDLFVPWPDEPAQPAPVACIAERTAESITELRQSGHNVIFGALALRALHEAPHLARPSIVDGICRLLDTFRDGPPGQGWYGGEGWRNDVRVDPAPDIPPYDGSQAVTDAVMNVLARYDRVRRNGYGGEVHVLTHAAALVELDELGYGDLARQGYVAHRVHIALRRTLPYPAPVKREFQTPAPDDPLSAAYWESEAAPRNHWAWGHNLKMLYAFYHLLPRVQDQATRRRGVEQIRVLMNG